MSERNLSIFLQKGLRKKQTHSFGVPSLDCRIYKERRGRTIVIGNIVTVVASLPIVTIVIIVITITAKGPPNVVVFHLALTNVLFFLGQVGEISVDVLSHFSGCGPFLCGRWTDTRLVRYSRYVRYVRRET